MKSSKLLLAAFFGASLGLVGCASTGTAEDRAVPPVFVKTDGDAATLLATNPYKATHFKIGARLYPRCQVVSAVESRLPQDYACLTDEEIRDVVENGLFIQREYSERGRIIQGQSTR